MAVAGLIAESMADPIMGKSNLKASSCQLMSTSSGSRVLREGTIAMSSKPNA
jgi:hypothetical protein